MFFLEKCRGLCVEALLDQFHVKFSKRPQLHSYHDYDRRPSIKSRGVHLRPLLAARQSTTTHPCRLPSKRYQNELYCL